MVYSKVCPCRSVQLGAQAWSSCAAVTTLLSGPSTTTEGAPVRWHSYQPLENVSSLLPRKLPCHGRFTPMVSHSWWSFMASHWPRVLEVHLCSV